MPLQVPDPEQLPPLIRGRQSQTMDEILRDAVASAVQKYKQKPQLLLVVMAHPNRQVVWM